VPFPEEGLMMGVAERYEIVCDLGKFPGQTLFLFNGRDPKRMKHVPYFCFSHLLAKIVVGPAGKPHNRTVKALILRRVSTPMFWHEVLHQ
jgi:hypothetical protein